ncbi:hypothetical protein C4D60_Mb05t21660 [Musa balbisiana]|uniref:Uncharacterized protein n=1 Tax=Musa balbisiana TaxID=52838 RepID=A0A4S8JXV4_MUSBA|nr:hypothetical protein C4D60_Mb05t21660 [Musa balbisiana]
MTAFDRSYPLHKFIEEFALMSTEANGVRGNQPQPKPSSDVILEEGDDKLVHLIRELLLNKMASFSNTGTSIFGSGCSPIQCPTGSRVALSAQF